GKGIKAKIIAVNIKKVRKKILSNEYSDILDRIVIVGLVCKLNNYWDKAKKLEVQVIETRKIRLRVDYPSTLISISNLDNTEKLEVQVIEICKTKLKVDYSFILISIINLVLIYRK
ncbi:hypothetical protein BKA64DRAFT_568952, partial [Cadophora sp. MPI-SDFR-AT-0126]